MVPRQDFDLAAGTCDGLGRNASWDDDTLIAVGHRVVHGGTDHVLPERITPELLDILERLVPLAPLHQPHNLAPIHAIAAAGRRCRRWPASIPPSIIRCRRWQRASPCRAHGPKTGVRRYGFHGLSYEYIAARLREIAPSLRPRPCDRRASWQWRQPMRDASRSQCRYQHGFHRIGRAGHGHALRHPGSGRGTAPDPQRGLTGKQVENLLYRQSGLLGVSAGIASDMRTLLASDDSRAKEAIDLFVYRIAREIGALASLARWSGRHRVHRRHWRARGGNSCLGLCATGLAWRRYRRRRQWRRGNVHKHTRVARRGACHAHR